MMGLYFYNSFTSFKGRRWRKPGTVRLLIVLLILVLYKLRFSLLPYSVVEPKIRATKPFCPQAELSDDIVVVIKTGATEAPEKLPIHFQTTLSCVPNYVIFSDFEEEIEGHHVYDVLEEVNDELKKDVSEFQLYNHLKAHGRGGLEGTDHSGSGPAGQLENPGWKLDKWKFLPMMEKTLRHKPEAKWYVFIETDTYLVWPNLLEYLSRLDSSKPYYIGKHMYIGDVLFAHGGSGFVLSNPAIRSVSEHRKSHLEEYDKFTSQVWAGDMLLGKVLKDVGVDLTLAFPHFQGDSVSNLNPNITKLDRKPWCFAPVTYHHMNQQEVRKLWNFEQDWLRQTQDLHTTLKHGDVFKNFIVPQIHSPLEDWDNLSIGVEYLADALQKLSAEEKEALPPVKRDAVASFEDCKAACEDWPACLQFSYSAAKCSLSEEFKLGEQARSQCLEYSNAAGKCIRSNRADDRRGSTVKSGWLMDRIEKFITEMDSLCDGKAWVE